MTASCQPEHRLAILLLRGLEDPPTVPDQRDEGDCRHGPSDPALGLERVVDADHTRPGHDDPRAELDGVPEGGSREGQHRHGPGQHQRAHQQHRCRIALTTEPEHRRGDHSDRRHDHERTRHATSGRQQGDPAGPEEQRGNDRGQRDEEVAHRRGAQPALAGPDDRLTTTGNLELGEDRRELVAHRLRRQEQLRAAMSAFFLPCASSSRTSRSRWVSSGNGYSATTAWGGSVK